MNLEQQIVNVLNVPIDGRFHWKILPCERRPSYLLRTVHNLFVLQTDSLDEALTETKRLIDAVPKEPG